MSNIVQRTLGSSNDGQSWLERFGFILWLIGVVAVWSISGYLTRPQLVVFALVWIAALGLILKRGWLKLFGPVLFYDIMRQVRKPRFFWLRFGYATTISVVLVWVYFFWWQEMNREHMEGVPIREVANFAYGFFTTFLTIQFILVALLTPAYTAGAIAEEKERKTLEFLLATDLRNREIVFGKLASRVGTLVLLLIAGMPILSLVQFFGGVDPDMLIAGFASLFISLLSIAAVSMYCSITVKKARDAIALTYSIMIAYLVVSALAFALKFEQFANDQGVLFGYTVTLGDFVDVFAMGNTFISVGRIEESIFMGGAVTADIIVQVLKEYAIFHGIVIFACLLFGVTRLRSVALKQSYGEVRRISKRERLAPRRPVVGNEAMLWKEIFVEPGLGSSLLFKFVLYLLMIVSFIPVVINSWDLWENLLFDGPFWTRDRWDDFGRQTHEWVMAVGTAVACLMFLVVGVRAAGSVSGERDKQTFESLMTTPLSSGQILWGKWWGAILGMRRAWMWLAMIWAVGLASGGLHLAALPGLLIAVFIYSGVCAWLGLWFSTVCRTTMNATISTICATIFLGGGYFLVFALCCVLPNSLLEVVSGSESRLVIDLLSGFSPAVVMTELPFYDLTPQDYGYRYYDHGVPFYVFGLIGMLAWAFLAAFLASVTQRRFRDMHNRNVKYPEQRERTPIQRRDQIGGE